MKKKIFGGILAVAIAAVAAVNVNFNNEADDALSALSLANVEALAFGEGPEKTKGTVVPCTIYENNVIVGQGNTCGGSSSNTCYSNPCT